MSERVELEWPQHTELSIHRGSQYVIDKLFGIRASRLLTSKSTLIIVSEKSLVISPYPNFTPRMEDKALTLIPRSLTKNSPTLYIGYTKPDYKITLESSERGHATILVHANSPITIRNVPAYERLMDAVFASRLS